jgi:hypothetical protein
MKCHLRGSMIRQNALFLNNENRVSICVELLEFICKWGRLQNRVAEYVDEKFVTQNKRCDTIVLRSFVHL